jgi:thiol:disulfide interchange protein DsbD
MHKIVQLILVVLVGLFSSSLWAQDSTSHIVQWEFLSSGKKDGAYVLEFKARIDSGWKLFSTTNSEDWAFTRVRLDSSVRGKIISLQEIGSLETKKEPVFDNTITKYFEKEVDFRLLVTAETAIRDIKGTIEFMAMRGDSVIPPESVPFRFSIDANGQASAKNTNLQESASAAKDLRRSSIDLHHPEKSCGGTGVESSSSKNLWRIFLLGFLGGLIALLTPCVFPMIPLTVSFFTKQGGQRRKGVLNASLYGFFIFLIYTLLSLPFYFLDSLNPEILNNISTNVWLNIFFFLVFIVFALSFFGLFEITVPGSLANSVDARAGLSSAVGIFFMALTLALVSFSCTGPILGSLLAGSLSSNGGAVQLTSGMAGFGLALSLPFTLFALFPGWLQSLPKSGGWLSSVKIVLGFLEIALAVKFLSNADLVEHWGILKREIFLGIWIITGILLTLYLFGIIRFRHDPAPKKLSRFRLIVAILFLSFTVYLVPGIFKSSHANRSLISGFPPPLSYSIYGNELVKLCGLEANLKNDYEAALKMAKQQNKPLMIDFTGWACVNCRKMEENVWTNPQVKNLIEKNFVLVSLYVDDRQKLADDEQFLFRTKDGYSKPIQTIGDRYATFQSENFVNASQPLYALLSPDEKLLTYPVGYTPDSKEFSAWLTCGIEAFNAIQSTARHP